MPRKITRDGINYEEETVHIILGTFFFYSTEKMEHYRIVANIVSALSNFGGMNRLITVVMGAIAIYFSVDFRNAKMLQKLYFHEINSKQKHG